MPKDALLEGGQQENHPIVAMGFATMPKKAGSSEPARHCSMTAHPRGQKKSPLESLPQFKGAEGFLVIDPFALEVVHLAQRRTLKNTNT